MMNNKHSFKVYLSHYFDKDVLLLDEDGNEIILNAFYLGGLCGSVLKFTIEEYKTLPKNLKNRHWIKERDRLEKMERDIDLGIDVDFDITLEQRKLAVQDLANEMNVRIKFDD